MNRKAIEAVALIALVGVALVAGAEVGIEHARDNITPEVRTVVVPGTPPAPIERTVQVPTTPEVRTVVVPGTPPTPVERTVVRTVQLTPEPRTPTMPAGAVTWDVGITEQEVKGGWVLHNVNLTIDNASPYKLEDVTLVVAWLDADGQAVEVAIHEYPRTVHANTTREYGTWRTTSGQSPSTQDEVVEVQVQLEYRFVYEEGE